MSDKTSSHLVYYEYFENYPTILGQTSRQQLLTRTLVVQLRISSLMHELIKPQHSCCVFHTLLYLIRLSSNANTIIILSTRFPNKIHWYVPPFRIYSELNGKLFQTILKIVLMRNNNDLLP